MVLVHTVESNALKYRPFLDSILIIFDLDRLTMVLHIPDSTKHYVLHNNYKTLCKE